MLVAIKTCRCKNEGSFNWIFHLSSSAGVPHSGPHQREVQKKEANGQSLQIRANLTECGSLQSSRSSAKRRLGQLDRAMYHRRALELKRPLLESSGFFLGHLQFRMFGDLRCLSHLKQHMIWNRSIIFKWWNLINFSPSNDLIQIQLIQIRRIGVPH